jgi:hypothetical protein
MERFDCSSSSSSSSSIDSDNNNSSSSQNKSSNEKENNQSTTTNQALRNFLAKLKDWDKVELEENIKERVKFTTQTVSKLVTNYDRY